MKNRLPFLAAMALLQAMASPAAEPRSAASTFTFESRDGALAISSGGQRVADYVYRDEKIPRPYFAHLCAPGGIQVTRNHPPQPGKDPTDHDALHPGLWLAFGDISGHDFWRNKASIRHERFTEPPAVRDGRLTFATESRLRTTNQQTLGTQVSRIALTVRPEGYLLVWEATFEAIEQDLFFGNQEEMGLGVRVATPITEKNGGLITGSTGTKTAKGTWGKAFDWCDYSGVIGDRRVGVTLMPDPANFRPSWFHNRDYGLMVANPFGRKAMGQGDLSRVEVKKGERLRLRFGVLMHSNTPEKHVDLAAAYRDVLEQSALFAVQPAEAAPELPDIFSYRAQDLAALRQGFVQPPREAGPWVYWFWWKSVVSRGEIARELEELAAAGIAGAELRVVTFHGWGGKPLAGMDPANLERLGHRKFAYLSDEWLDVMEFTCSEAQRLGLRLAINLGQGWPPGGPWIGDAHRTKHLSWKSQEVHGPGTFSPEDLPAEGMVLAWKLADTGRSKTVATNSFLDLTSLISRQGSRRALTWEVPAGRWLVGVFSVTPGGICDKGEGPEVDPASREAVLFHLDHMFSRLDPKLRRFYGTTLVDVASDSWEYERNRDGGRYFSPAILDAFPKGAGYDFRERMHALLDYGPDAERVRHDLEAVERHLIHENYFATVARFLNERGLRHRPQIYGRGLSRDLLEAYTLADTPEIEQGICLPEGPWAAHAAGRPIVSAEAFTFLSDKLALVRRPHGPWETAPAALRWSANHFFGEGINRIQMHSFSYSPPGLPLPGWRMYAEVHLNRNVPWWPFMVPLNVWISRQQWLLQAGRPVADALVYPVKSDPEDGPFFSMGDRQPLSAANAIDAANERTLPLVPRAVGAGRYDVRTLVLLKAPTTAEEARQVLALIGAGARLLCCHSLPADWPALRTAGGEALREGFARLEASGMIADARAGGWKAALAQARSVCWSPAEANLVFQHRRLRDGDIYFLVNYGEAFRGEVSFPHLGERAEVWNADTGQTAPVGRYAEHHGRIHIPVALDHFASASFVFSRGPVAVHVTDAPGGEFHFDTGVGLMGRFDRSGDYSIQLSDGTTHEIAVALPPPLRIDGPWELSVSASQAVSPQAPLTLRLDRLVSWRELPELKQYAGAATYTTDFDVSPELLGGDFALFLDLGEVFELARVTIDGRDAGTAWTPPFRLEVTGLLKSSRNTLRIDVPNVLKNHLETGDDYRRPSGLLGPVKLVPSRRAALAGSPESRGSAAPPEFRQTEVFRSREGGYHTYRIPALIETRAGTLLAFCEGRKDGDSDRGDIDLLLRRSTDGGITWSPMQTIWDDGANTCGNPCPVVDRESGAIWLLMTWNSARLLREADVQAGFGEDSRRVFVTRSSDDGSTWAEPVEITASAKRPEWTWYATGPGNGIQLRSGRLVIPCNHKVKANETLSCRSHILYSDDRGRTWKLGGEADDKTNESTVVELEDDSLLLNMRSNFNRNRRAIARSQDAGLTWMPVAFDEALIEPVCQASLVTARRWCEASDELLFSNPAGAWRARLTVRLSRDGGRTWSAYRLIHEGPSAYSSLCVLGQDEAGLLYERGRQRPYEGLTYARFSLRWLAAGDEGMPMR